MERERVRWVDQPADCDKDRDGHQGASTGGRTPSLPGFWAGYDDEGTTRTLHWQVEGQDYSWYFCHHSGFDSTKRTNSRIRFMLLGLR